MFNDQISEEIAAVALEFGLKPAALLAIAEVESGGQVFSIVDGRSEPLIRFEGHYFDRRLSEDNRTQARAQGLASPKAGEIANPASQAARWRLLERAAAIDRKAAYEFVSWGLGQVMGAHWAWLGFADVDALVAEARSGAAGQARLMARYIKKAGLVTAIENHDWEAFAHGYNGPDYKRYSYHLKLAAAYRRCSGASPDARSAEPRAGSPAFMRKGSAGDEVRDLQLALSALGYPLETDGIFGKATEHAVQAFQTYHDLTADGIAGPGTLAAIRKAMPFGAPSNGFSSSFLNWLAGLFGRR